MGDKATVLNAPVFVTMCLEYAIGYRPTMNNRKTPEMKWRPFKYCCIQGNSNITIMWTNLYLIPVNPSGAVKGSAH